MTATMLEDVASMLVDPVRHSIPVPKLIRTRYGIVVIGTETTAMASEVLNCDINNIRVAGCIHIDSTQIMAMERRNKDYHLISSIGLLNE